MSRETVINVLLIIAGIVLAIALFGAGVLWKMGTEKGPKSLLSVRFASRSFRVVGKPEIEKSQQKSAVIDILPPEKKLDPD